MVGINNLEFISPDKFPIISGVILLLLLFGFIAIYRKYKILKKFSELSFVSLGKIKFKQNFLILFLDISILSIIAIILMQPVLLKEKTILEYDKRYFSIWLDVSISSTAKDVLQKDQDKEKYISRLELEKQEVFNLLKRIEQDYVSLGIFAERAYTITSPLLINELTKENMLISIEQELNKFTPDKLRFIKQGSNLGAVILEGSTCFRDVKFFNNKKIPKRVIIILSDGEEIGNNKKLNEMFVKAVNKFKDYDDVSLYIVGIGDPYGFPEGTTISSTDRSNINAVELDKNNQPIKTKPNFEFLNDIARRLNGTFIEAKKNDELSKALDDILLIEREKNNEKTIIVKDKNIFRIFALIAISLMLVRALIKNP